VATDPDNIDKLVNRRYRHGFITDIESDSLPPGLDEDVVRAITARKTEPGFMLEWRLRAYRQWRQMREPTWAHVHYPAIDYDAISYYSAPRSDADRPKSLDEVDPKLLETYDKLGIPLHERARLAGVAVDAVFDSVSVATTFKAKLSEAGVIFCPFSEAVQKHPELVQKYLGSVVPQTTSAPFHGGKTNLMNVSPTSTSSPKTHHASVVIPWEPVRSACWIWPAMSQNGRTIFTSSIITKAV
jgi:Fe-S cluster assembly protein SufB